ncbi:MAG: hypothetical protein GEU73_17070 [Chloroflexi bacterium]|nr:hypothetical protein [Chloroflexota bacterium]
MAELVGCVAMSHAPQVMIDPDNWDKINVPRNNGPLAPELQNLRLETKWERWNRCMVAVQGLRETLDAVAPDTVIVVGDDQMENLRPDAGMPPFTLFIGDEADASWSLKYLGQTQDENRPRYKVDAKLGGWIIDDLQRSGFDPAYARETRYAAGLGHAFARVLKHLTPSAQYPILPIMVNTYYPPGPSAARCAQFGRALAQAIERFPGGRRVMVVGSGGLSHTDIDVDLDTDFVRALEQNDVAFMEEIPEDKLVGGTSEIKCWIVTASAADRPVSQVTYEPIPRAPWGAGVGMGFAAWNE